MVPVFTLDGSDDVVPALQNEPKDLLHARQIGGLDVVRQLPVCIEHRMKEHFRTHGPPLSAVLQ
jgi:hypothetical protein